MIVYQTGKITVTQKKVFGKIGLSAYNAEHGATATAFAKDESEIPEKVAWLVIEVEKDNRIDLSKILAKAEQKFFGN